MSALVFLASDCVIQEVKNPYVKTLSINESLEQGYDVSDYILNSHIDKDKPNALLWVEDEEKLGEITINSFNKESYIDEIPTTKKYCSELCFDYTEQRAKQVIHYIKKHLETSKEIELWYIWLNNNNYENKLKKYCININDLTTNNIKKICKDNSWDEQVCMLITC